MRVQAQNIMGKQSKKVFFHRKTAALNPRSLSNEEFSKYLQNLFYIHEKISKKRAYIPDESTSEIFSDVKRFSEFCVKLRNPAGKPMISEWLQDPRMITFIALINVLANFPSSHLTRYSHEFTNYYKSLPIAHVTPHILGIVNTYVGVLSYMPEKDDLLSTSILHQLSLIKSEAKNFRKISKEIKSAEAKIEAFFNYQINPPREDQISVISSPSARDLEKWKKAAVKGNILFIRRPDRRWLAVLKSSDKHLFEEVCISSRSNLHSILNELKNNPSQNRKKLEALLKTEIIFPYYAPPLHYDTASNTLTETILQQINDVDNRVHFTLCDILEADKCNDIPQSLAYLFDALFKQQLRGLRGTLPMYDENFHIEFFSKLLILLREISRRHYSSSLVRELMKDYPLFTDEYAVIQTINKLHASKFGRLQRLNQALEEIFINYSGSSSLSLFQKSTILANLLKEPFLEILIHKEDQKEYQSIKAGFLKKCRLILINKENKLTTLPKPLSANDDLWDDPRENARLISTTIHQAINMHWDWVSEKYQHIPLVPKKMEGNSQKIKAAYSIWDDLSGFFTRLWEGLFSSSKPKPILKEPIKPETHVVIAAKKETRSTNPSRIQRSKSFSEIHPEEEGLFKPHKTDNSIPSIFDELDLAEPLLKQ